MFFFFLFSNICARGAGDQSVLYWSLTHHLHILCICICMHTSLKLRVQRKGSIQQLHLYAISACSLLYLYNYFTTHNNHTSFFTTSLEVAVWGIRELPALLSTTPPAWATQKPAAPVRVNPTTRECDKDLSWCKTRLCFIKHFKLIWTVFEKHALKNNFHTCWTGGRILKF